MDPPLNTLDKIGMQTWKKHTIVFLPRHIVQPSVRVDFTASMAPWTLKSARRSMNPLAKLRETNCLIYITSYITRRRKLQKQTNQVVIRLI